MSDMVYVERDVLRLVCAFLDEYAERLGNNGCNDWEFPEWASDDIRKLIRDAGEIEGDDSIVNDWEVVDGLINVINGRLGLTALANAVESKA